MTRITISILLFTVLATGLGVASATEPKGDDPAETRYLVFQLMTGLPGYAGPQPKPGSFALGKEQLEEFVHDVVKAIGTTGDVRCKLGFTVGPLCFNMSDEETRQFIRDSFAVARENDVAVAFHIDDSMSWGERQDLLSNSDNIETADWQQQPTTGRRADWGPEPTKFPPQMCFNSPDIQSAVNQRGSLIGAEVTRELDALRSSGKGHLFAGLIAGWETRIGRDFDTNRLLGYRALSHRGFSADQPPQDPDLERVRVVKEFMELWANALHAAGIPREKIFCHIAFTPQGLRGTDATDSFAKHVDFAPPEVAFSSAYRPGFSTYPEGSTFKEIYAALAQHGSPSWVSAEGVNVSPNGMPGEPTMETYLGRMFNHGAVMVNIFSWGIGGEAMRDNFFRQATENPEALAAYAKFLRHETLIESAPTGFSAQAFQDKMHRIQKELPDWVRKSGQQARVMPLVQRLEALMKDRKWQEADKVADELLSAAPTDAEDRASQQLAETITQALQDSAQEMEQRHLQIRDKRTQALAAVKSVSTPEYEAAWNIDLDVDQQPAQGVLERLVTDMGLQLANGAEHADALRKPVNLHLQGVSRLQAIESLCSQIGVYPDYRLQPSLSDAGPFAAMAQLFGAADGQPSQPAEAKPEEDALPAVTLRPGPRPIPLAFAGPFAIEAMQLLEFPPDATGTIDVCLFAGGVPESVLACWNEADWGGSAFHKPPLSFGKWQETGGRDVLMSDQVTGIGGTAMVLPGLTTQLELRNLLRDVQTIRLATEITATLPTKVETICFDDLSVAPVTRGTDYQLTLRKVQTRAPTAATETRPATTGSCTISMESTGSFGTHVEFIALDADGQPININGGWFNSGNSYAAGKDGRWSEVMKTSLSIDMLGVPKTLIAKVFVAEQRLSYPAEVVVDLRSWSDQPQQLSELQYDGSCPIEIEVLQIRTEGLFRVVDVKVKNNSNKNIRSVDAKMQYRDRAGTVVGEHNAMLSSSPEPGDSRFLLARAKTTQPAHATAFDAPDDLASVTFVLGRVHFGDGTEWVPPRAQ